MPNKRDVVRFQAELTRAQMEELEELMKMISVTTKKDLLSNALTTLKWAIREKAKGSAIVAVNDRSDIPNRELLMPFLENIVPKQNRPGFRGRFDAKTVQASARVVEVAIETGRKTRSANRTAPFQPSTHRSTPALAGEETRLTLTPFEKWVIERKKSGSSTSWRDFVREMRQVPAADLAEDDFSLDRE